MRKSRFSEEQIIGILREAEGTSVNAVCARHNISAATYYGWKAKFGGMDVNEAGAPAASFGRREPPVEERGGGPGAADLDLERGELKKVVSPSQKRRAIKHVIGQGKGTTADSLSQTVT